MNCSICGAFVQEGQTNCPNCGAVVQPVQPMGGYQQPAQPMGGYQQPAQPMGGYQQPVQPMGGYQQPVQPMGGYQQSVQPMGGYQQSAQPMGGYQQSAQPIAKPAQAMGGGLNLNNLIGKLNGDIMKIVGLVGAFLIAITPFFTWCKYEVDTWLYSGKDSANMFGLAGGDIDEGIFTFLGMLLVLAGLAVIMWDLADYVPQFTSLKAKVSMIPFFDLILVGVALISIIIALANGTVNDFIDAMDEVGKSSHGAGPVVGFIGIIATAAPRVFNILGIKIGK